MNASGQTVAWYVLKIPGEQYANSSGCMLGVEEPYPHLAVGKTSSRHVKAEGWSTDGGYDRFPRDTIGYAAYRSTHHLKAVS